MQAVTLDRRLEEEGEEAEAPQAAGFTEEEGGGGGRKGHKGGKKRRDLQQQQQQQQKGSNSNINNVHRRLHTTYTMVMEEYTSGRLMGGGTSINGEQYVWPTRRLLDSIQAMAGGDPDWSADNVFEILKVRWIAREWLDYVCFF